MSENLEVGILKKNGIYFHESSDFARKNMYYLHWGAYYECDSNYSYHHDYLDAFILFYIVDGSMTYSYRGQVFTVGPQSIVLLDCTYSNSYWSETGVKFQWFHFSGGNTKDFCEHFYKENLFYFDSSYSSSIRPLMDQIQALISKEDSSDFQISPIIYQILCQLMKEKSSKANASSNLMLQAAIYIKEHLEESLLVEDIAKHFGLSLYHFTRIFKTAIGTTPHDYLFSLRISKAKQLLSGSYESIDSTAILCGFSSTSHFIRAFKKSTGFTPRQFRQIF